METTMSYKRPIISQTLPAQYFIGSGTFAQEGVIQWGPLFFLEKRTQFQEEALVETNPFRPLFHFEGGLRARAFATLQSLHSVLIENGVKSVV